MMSRPEREALSPMATRALRSLAKASASYALSIEPRVLASLVRRGLVEPEPGSNCYRITQAGRLALDPHEHSSDGPGWCEICQEHRRARGKCSGCPHPPHTGLCTRRNGGTAYACLCSRQESGR